MAEDSGNDNHDSGLDKPCPIFMFSCPKGPECPHQNVRPRFLDSQLRQQHSVEYVEAQMFLEQERQQAKHWSSETPSPFGLPDLMQEPRHWSQKMQQGLGAEPGGESDNDTSCDKECTFAHVAAHPRSARGWSEDDSGRGARRGAPNQDVVRKKTRHEGLEKEKGFEKSYVKGHEKNSTNTVRERSLSSRSATSSDDSEYEPCKPEMAAFFRQLDAIMKGESDLKAEQLLASTCDSNVPKKPPEKRFLPMSDDSENEEESWTTYRPPWSKRHNSFSSDSDSPFADEVEEKKGEQRVVPNYWSTDLISFLPTTKKLECWDISNPFVQLQQDEDNSRDGSDSTERKPKLDANEIEEWEKKADMNEKTNKKESNKE